MKRLKTKVRDAIIDTSCVALGAIHFVSQTSADIAMSIEASLKMRSTGEVPEDIKKERMLRTIIRQRWVLDRYEAAQERLSRRKAHQNVSAFADKDPLGDIPSEHYQINPMLINKNYQL